MRTIKSKEARANWATLLRDAEKGAAVTIELYDRPVAKLVPYRVLNAVAHTFNEGTWATVSIGGLSMAEAPDYPDHVPGAHARKVGDIWEVSDRGAERNLVVIGSDLDDAIRSWAGRLGYLLESVTIDPEYDADPEADW